MNNAPIGIFDSGLGGISVLRLAQKILPNENFIYYGDNKNAPYGNKSKEEIYNLSQNCVEFLVEKGVKAIVIACNTATGVSVKTLREDYDLPIISMEPAVKVGVENLHGGKIAVMATCATLKQQKYLNLIQKLHVNDVVLPLPCENLAGLIEQGEVEGEIIKNYLREKLEFIKTTQVDSIVLGCTHYVFIKDVLKDVLNEFGQNIEIVDGGMGTVKQLKHVLSQNNLLSSSKVPGEITLYTSGDKEKVMGLFHKMLYELPMT